MVEKRRRGERGPPSLFLKCPQRLHKFHMIQELNLRALPVEFVPFLQHVHTLHEYQGLKGRWFYLSNLLFSSRTFTDSTSIRG
jgi:hypothetical protein